MRLSTSVPQRLTVSTSSMKRLHAALAEEGSEESSFRTLLNCLTPHRRESGIETARGGEGESSPESELSTSITSGSTLMVNEADAFG